MPESPLTKISFIEPMSALAVRKLPEGLDWLYEIKFDGYRCLAGKDAGGVSLWSRRGNDFTSQFPAIAKACEYLPVGTLVDGEIVATGRQRANLVQPDAASSVPGFRHSLLCLRHSHILWPQHAARESPKAAQCTHRGAVAYSQSILCRRRFANRRGIRGGYDTRGDSDRPRGS